MPKTSKDQIKLMRQLRDAKVHPHLEQYAPVWLVEDTPLPEDEALQFDVVFFHPRYGWVTRRYRFDAFSQVLYHLGERTISEDEALNLTDQKPYIAAKVINTVDAYGG
jgi:hypothetical protein